MTKIEYLQKAIEKNGSAYRFCKNHKLDLPFITRVLSGAKKLSPNVAKAIAHDLGETEEEMLKIFAEIMEL